MKTSKRRRTILGSLYLLAGAAALIYAASLGADIDWSFWALFAIASVILSFKSVEVNDRLQADASVMALFTIGVILAVRQSGAVFGMALMAAVSPLVPDDLKQRRIFQPAVNFGQLTVAATAAGLSLKAVLGEITEFELGRSGDLLKIAVAGSVAAIAYTAVNTTLVRIVVRSVWGRSALLPWSGMPLLVWSQAVMGLLGGLLGAVLLVTTNSILPLVLLVYVIGHLVFSSYSQLRQAHESTLRGFVKTLEARDLYTRGHTERVATFCRVIGEQLRFGGTQLEAIRWAALVHDVGKLAIPLEIMSKQGPLDDDEYRRLRGATHRVDDLLSKVEFLRPMVEVASGSHPRLAGEDFGQVGHRHTTVPTLEQQVLAVADAFDAMTSPRGYRMAMSQSAALAALYDDPGPLFDSEVVAALERGLELRGERYGPPEIDEPVVGYAERRSSDAPS